MLHKQRRDPLCRLTSLWLACPNPNHDLNLYLNLNLTLTLILTLTLTLTLLLTLTLTLTLADPCGGGAHLEPSEQPLGGVHAGHGTFVPVYHDR